MRLAHVVEIVTPKKYVLNGLWFGPKKPKRVIIWVHGLGSSMFSKLSIVDELLDSSTAILMFNNRGHDKVASLPHASRSFKKALRAGAAHEVFTDCVDDIQGAVNFARRQKARDVFLAGHSTGCQKAFYYASKKPRGIKGIIILGPVSDFSAETFLSGKKKIQRARMVAESYIRRGKKQLLLPEEVWGWPWIADAQRFLSLYSGKSPEEIFTYWDSSKNPRILKKVRVPTLVFLAQKEQFTDIPAKTIAEWFEKHLQAPHTVTIIPKVGHSFRGAEGAVASAIHKFMVRS